MVEVVTGRCGSGKTHYVTCEAALEAQRGKFVYVNFSEELISSNAWIGDTEWVMDYLTEFVDGDNENVDVCIFDEAQLDFGRDMKDEYLEVLLNLYRSDIPVKPRIVMVSQRFEHLHRKVREMVTVVEEMGMPAGR